MIAAKHPNPRNFKAPTPAQLRIVSEAEAAPIALPQVKESQRQGNVLQAGPVPENRQVLSLHVARGCAHRCAFCSARAAPTYPGDDVVLLAADIVAPLAAELDARREPLKAVLVSPATDPFPPLAAVQATTAQVVAVLANHGVEAWLMTRGYIRPSAFKVLVQHRSHVKVTMGLTTLDRTLRQQLEPLTAPPRLRLRQIAQLRREGIEVQVALEPLVPGLTDTKANLTEVLDALAGVGIQRVTASYMFLRPGIEENLRRALQDQGWDELVLSAFHGGPVLSSGGLAAARYLPKARRQRGYAALMTLAAERGITVSIARLTNPDFRTTPSVEREDRPRQRLLPLNVKDRE